MLLALSLACSDYSFGGGTEASAGSGVALEETFIVEQDAGDATDVLFAFDSSGSMQGELDRLGNRIPAFLESLDLAGDDWRLMSLSDPQGCNASGVLSPDVAGYEEIFERSLVTDAAENESLLVSVARALGRVAPGDCNQGFLREEVTTHVIILADEPDQSPGFESQGYWADYLASMELSAPDLRVSAIVGPPSGVDDCEGAFPGTGYIEAAAVSGGLLLPICSNWGDAINQLAQVTTVQSIFPLAAPPVVETLEVSIDGSGTTAWTYDSAQQAVEIESGELLGGEEVRVVYEVL